MPAIQNQGFTEKALNAIKVAELGAAPANPMVKLIAQDFTPTKILDPAGLTEASFPGYTPYAITAWLPTHFDSAGNAIINATTLASFTASGPVSPAQTIYGYYMIDSHGDNVQCEKFNPPMVFSASGDTEAFSISVALAGFGESASVMP